MKMYFASFLSFILINFISAVENKKDLKFLENVYCTPLPIDSCDECIKPCICSYIPHPYFPTYACNE